MSLKNPIIPSERDYRAALDRIAMREEIRRHAAAGADVLKVDEEKDEADRVIVKLYRRAYGLPDDGP